MEVTTMNTTLALAGRTVLSLALAVLVVPASAERPYRFSDREVQTVVRRIDDRAGEFRKHLDSALDRSAFDGSQREDNINEFARDFKESTSRLRDHLGDGRRSAAEVEEVLGRASMIEQFMRRNRLDERAERDWVLLSADLSELARMYGVRWGRTRWAGHPADSEVAALLKRIEDRTAEFRHSLDGALDRGRLAGTRREDEIIRHVNEFVRATDRMQVRFRDQRAGSGDVREMLRRAQPIDRFVRRWQLEGRAERTWNALRGDLQRLGQFYRVEARWAA
jgi:hypothetical protein